MITFSDDPGKGVKRFKNIFKKENFTSEELLNFNYLLKISLFYR